MGGSSSKKGTAPAGNTTTTSTDHPWSGQSPYLKEIYGGAQDLANTDPAQYYPGQTVAPYNSDQTNSWNMEAQRGMDGSPVTSSADNYATNLENGNFLSAGNPYFGDMVNTMGEALKPQVDSEFAADGRSGSPANDYAFSSGLTNEAGNLAGSNYQNVLGDMNSQAFNAPSLANEDYTNIGAVDAAGNQSQAAQQQYVNEDMSRFYGDQQAPWQTLGEMSSLVGSPTQGGGSVSTPYFMNSKGANKGAASSAMQTIGPMVAAMFA